jgi:pyruvate dehydrogenase E2 component (dihydrolipoamide acetyltransferase)
MPQLGETVTEGTITRWFKQVGEQVAVDEPLFEVSTDKVDSEVPAPAAGVVSEILVAEGDTVDVGARLAVISDASAVAAPAAAAPPAAPRPAVPPPFPPAPQTPATAPDPPPLWAQPPAPRSRTPEPPALPASSAPPPSPAASPQPQSRPAAPEPPPADPKQGPSPSWAPVVPAARFAPEPAPDAPPEPAPPAANSAGPSVTSPLVRRMIAEQGLDPAQIQGSGDGGRITRNDVVEAARGSAPAPAARAPEPASSVPARAPEAPSAPPAVPPAAASVAHTTGDEVIPFDNIRRRTAEHVVRSKATSAHVYTSVRVDFERVDRARRANQALWRAEEGFSLTYLPFIVRAFCDVVHDYPNVNASVDGDSLVIHRDLHLGIAVDLEFKGLVAPVIRNADGKRLRLIAREIRDLAARAKSKQLGPDDVVGGTFTITNMGPFGTALTLPIINQPQVAILATDGIRKEAVVVDGPDGDDTIAIHHVGMLALAWDHRAFDGAYAASFLNEARQVLETRDWDPELA